MLSADEANMDFVFNICCSAIMKWIIVIRDHLEYLFLIKLQNLKYLQQEHLLPK